MKYMGSKRWMLRNGLGDLIDREVKNSDRFVDLFAGSGAVSTHVARKYNIPVAAYDLQTFSIALSRAVLGRESEVEGESLWADWYRRAENLQKSLRPPSTAVLNKMTINLHREWSANQGWTVTRAYGGYYFSAPQAVWLDALMQGLPTHEPARSVALAALISAASQCAAAPGHTAQPFQPTRSAKPYLVGAWRQDLVGRCKKELSAISKQYARRTGHAEVADANDIATLLTDRDLAFIDPPYSGVHYSRFYHVLETLARGACGAVSGTGRYPPSAERPRSKYSLKSGSSSALEDLLKAISSRRAKAILTFPQRKCSNGLSGKVVIELASAYFTTEQHWVASKFSTLGGNNDHRDARRSTRELILVLSPR
ncbi:MAG TPA: DNA adenine methylase [Candidatus Sulfotelmatobacter sp.]|nr:DNA adenine methylase [Candidatus Sulfotelmatobacter sp.]